MSNELHSKPLPPGMGPTEEQRKAYDDIAPTRDRSRDLIPPVTTSPAGAGELKPIDRDEDYKRDYIPLPGGWEIQTKGRGSSFRICNTKTGDRLLIPEQPYVHEMLEQMAREVHSAWTASATTVAPKVPDDVLNTIDMDYADTFEPTVSAPGDGAVAYRMYDTRWTEWLRMPIHVEHQKAIERWNYKVEYAYTAPTIDKGPLVELVREWRERSGHAKYEVEDWAAGMLVCADELEARIQKMFP